MLAVLGGLAEFESALIHARARAANAPWRTASGLAGSRRSPIISSKRRSNSACEPGVLKLPSAVLRSFVQPAGPACLSTASSPEMLMAPNTVLSESVIAVRVASSLTVPE
jgi:hypothetical protein